MTIQLSDKAEVELVLAICRLARAWVGTSRGHVEILRNSHKEPHWRGNSGHWTTPAGKPVRYPNAYRKAFGRPIYHCSTERISVGELWLQSRMVMIFLEEVSKHGVDDIAKANAELRPVRSVKIEHEDEEMFVENHA